MLLDASVIVAAILSEPEADEIIRDLSLSPTHQTTPIAVFEASSAVVRQRRVSFDAALLDVEEWLDRHGVQIVPIDLAMMRSAHTCASRYHFVTGHPARLNMGDCFAYAAARTRGLKLAYKGDDFVHTDADAVRFGG
jgi:ribonuclease VapC